MYMYVCICMYIHIHTQQKGCKLYVYPNPYSNIRLKHVSRALYNHINNVPGNPLIEDKSIIFSFS